MIQANNLSDGFKFCSYNREDGWGWRRVSAGTWERLTEYLNKTGVIGRLVLVDTTHRGDVFTGDIEDKKIIAADSLISRERGLAVAMLTADCAPLVLVDKVTGAWAFVHINWYGAASGQAERAAKEMVNSFGTKPGDIVGVIGPTICADCYIQKGWRGLLKRLVYSLFGQSGSIKKINKLGKVEVGLDLRAGILNSLNKVGVIKEKIEDLNICPCHDGWPSHAREGAARESSLISILEIG